MKQSRFDTGRGVQGLILFGFSIYLIKLLGTGEVNNLLSPLASNLLMVTTGVLIVMTFYCFATMFKKETGHDHHHHHDHVHAHDHGHQHSHHGHIHAHDHSPEHHHHELAVVQDHAHGDCGHANCSHDHGHHHSHAHAHADCGYPHDHHGHEHHHHHDHEDCGHDHDHNPKPRIAWAIIAAPMVIGLIFPTHSLGVNMMSSGLQVAPSQMQVINAEVTQTSTSTATTQTTQAPATTTTASSSDANKQPTAQTDANNQNGNAQDAKSLAESTRKTDMTKVPRTKGTVTTHPTVGNEVQLNDMLAGIGVEPQNYYDQRFKFVGLVYHVPGWPADRFILLRHMIAHCSADSTMIGIVVQSPDAAKFENDQWVEVYATVALQKNPEFDNIAPIAWFRGYPYKPLLIGHELKQVEQPKYPYLFSKTAI